MAKKVSADGKKPSFFVRAAAWLKAHNIYNRKFYKKHGSVKSRFAKFGTSFVAMGLILTVVLTVAEVNFGLISIFRFWVSNRGFDNTEYSKEELGVSDEAEKMYTGITNIMIYGIDSRTANEESRSDAIMMLTVDMDKKKIKMTSIARDTYVSIPGYGSDKLNHAFIYGWHNSKATDIKGKIADGALLSMNTINSTFGLNVKDYVTVNFWALADIVDYVGGVEIDVSEAERRDINWRLIPHIQEMGIKCEKIPATGLQTLSGGQALAYCRERYVDGDVERGNRQREVLTAVFAKVGTLSATQYPKLLEILLEECYTSLSRDQLWDLGMWAVKNMSSVSLENLGLPTADIDNGGTYINGVWYYTYDLEKAKQKIQDFILETNTTQGGATDGE